MLLIGSVCDGDGDGDAMPCRAIASLNDPN